MNDVAISARFYLTSSTMYRRGGRTYHEGNAVCRGDHNKEWAAATPVGSIKIRDEVFDGFDGSEFTALLVSDPDGQWEVVSAAKSYAGHTFEIERYEEGSSGQWGTGEKISLGVRAGTPAHKRLTLAMIDQMTGCPGHWSIVIEPDLDNDTSGG